MKMLVVDLDGSALQHDGNCVSQPDQRAAARLKDAGVTVTIATGRLWSGAALAAKALGVQGPVCVMNGSALHDASTGEVVSCFALDDDQLARIRGVLAKNKLPPLLFGTDGIRYPQALHASHGDYLQMWSPKHRTTKALIDQPWDEAILAVSSLGGHDEIEAVAAALDDGGLSTRTFDTFTGERFVEVRINAVDKGVGLRGLAAAHGLGVEQCVVMGDWWNDVPMFKVAGRSFVMAESGADVTSLAPDRLTAVRGCGGGIEEIAKRVWDV